MEIKDNPMSRKPKPIQTVAKFKSTDKYYEYYKDWHTTSKFTSQ